jgi:hypothetical protein
MNLTKKTILALGTFAVAVASHAQTTSTGTAPAAVLGQQYSEVSFGVSDIRHLSPNLYSTTISDNLPLCTYADASAGYTYDWIKGGAIAGHANTLSAGTRLFTSLAGVRPFIGLGLGWQWSHLAGVRDNTPVWNASLGTEIRAGESFVVLPQIVYHDDMQSASKSAQDWTYQVEGNYRLSGATALFASVGFADDRRSSFDSWNYRAGVRMKF